MQFGTVEAPPLLPSLLPSPPPLLRLRFPRLLQLCPPRSLAVVAAAHRRPQSRSHKRSPRTPPPPPPIVHTGTWRLFNVEVPAHKDPGKDHFSLSEPLLEAIASALDCPIHCLPPKAFFSVIRKSFDARKRSRDPKFVYVVDLYVENISILSMELRSSIAHMCNKPGRIELLSLDEKPVDLTALVNRSKAIVGQLPMASVTLPKEIGGNPAAAKPQTQNVPVKSQIPSKVCVVGSGPAGLFAALVLAESGAKVILVERGQPVERRGRDIGGLMVRRLLQPDSNFCFGEGGAGTWSDGKLTTGIGRNSEAVQMVLATLVKFGAPPHILIDGKPHIGTDKLIHILRKFRSHLQSLGVEMMFGSKMIDFLMSGNQVSGVKVTRVSDVSELGIEKLPSDAVVLAVGHSARDIYSKLLEHNVLLTPKDFAVGFRVEHPQELINEIQYNKWALEVQRGSGKIPVADYRVSTIIEGHKSDHDGMPKQYGCYSFCMCPGGQIVPTSTNPSELCINGMSFSKRSSKWANSAIVLTVSSQELEPFSAEHGPLAGVAFQRLLEKEAALMGGGAMVAPVQIIPDFLDNRKSGHTLPSSSYRLGVKEAALHTLFPEHLTDMFKRSLVDFNRQLPGFIDRRALLHAVETRTSSPVRIERNWETFECLTLPGLYPIGEGAGYAGGIVSAAVDGLHAGFMLARQFGLCGDVLKQHGPVDQLSY